MGSVRVRVVVAAFVILAGLGFGLASGVDAIPPPASECNALTKNVVQLGADGVGTYKCICLRDLSTGIDKCRWTLWSSSPAWTNSRTYLVNGLEWVWGAAETSNSKGYADVLVYDGYGPWQRAPGSIRLRNVLQKYNGAANTWDTCLDTGYLTNTTAATGLAVWWGYSSPPCGAGWYNTVSTGHNLNGSWHGGTVQSGAYLLDVPAAAAASPASPASAADRPASPPFDRRHKPPVQPVVADPPPPGPMAVSAADQAAQLAATGATLEEKP